MSKKSMIETLALPMFASGILAMIASASISLGATAQATSPVEYQKVTLTYLSSGYSASDSNCGSSQEVYSSNSVYSPSIRSKYSGSSSNDKQFLCTATFYMVTNVNIPTPKPMPTMTVIYSPNPGPTSQPPVYPTQYPTYRPTPAPKPTPTASPKPTYSSNWWLNPTPAPTRPTRP